MGRRYKIGFFYKSFRKKSLFQWSKHRNAGRREMCHSNTTWYDLIFYNVFIRRPPGPHNCHSRESIVGFKPRLLHINKATIYICWKQLRNENLNPSALNSKWRSLKKKKKSKSPETSYTEKAFSKEKDDLCLFLLIWARLWKWPYAQNSVTELCSIRLKQGPNQLKLTWFRMTYIYTLQNRFLKKIWTAKSDSMETLESELL